MFVPDDIYSNKVTFNASFLSFTFPEHDKTHRQTSEATSEGTGKERHVATSYLPFL
jgi:hypothetical protein